MRRFFVLNGERFRWVDRFLITEFFLDNRREAMDENGRNKCFAEYRLLNGKPKFN